MQTNHEKKRTFEILFQDEDFVAIDKPRGFHVHPPEQDSDFVPRHKIVLSLLRNQTKTYLFPIHRLDVATSGVLLFAKSSEIAGAVSKTWSHVSTRKEYEALIRGFPKSPTWTTALELESDSSAQPVAAVTSFQTLKQVELPYPAGKRFLTSRLSWIKAHPLTGRYHQIRRHLNRLSLPIIGDTDHGDSHYNRFVREKLQIQGLCLRAFELEFLHPRTGKILKIQAPRTHMWRQIEKLMTHTDEFISEKQRHGALD